MSPIKAISLGSALGLAAFIATAAIMPSCGATEKELKESEAAVAANSDTVNTRLNDAELEAAKRRIANQETADLRLQMQSTVSLEEYNALQKKAAESEARAQASAIAQTRFIQEAADANRRSQILNAQLQAKIAGETQFTQGVTTTAVGLGAMVPGYGTLAGVIVGAIGTMFGAWQTAAKNRANAQTVVVTDEKDRIAAAATKAIAGVQVAANLGHVDFAREVTPATIGKPAVTVGDIVGSVQGESGRAFVDSVQGKITSEQLLQAA